VSAAVNCVAQCVQSLLLDQLLCAALTQEVLCSRGVMFVEGHNTHPQAHQNPVHTLVS